MTNRQYHFLDECISAFDNGLRTLLTTPQSARANPASLHGETELDDNEQRHIAGLMRVNHCGEVCAQALYQAQKITCKDPEIKAAMAQASEEENDHLNWCATRLEELGSHTSYLNPLFYGASFAIGTLAGFAGNGYNLGFVAETEDQVTKHLHTHMNKVPEKDQKTQAILQQMATDEQAHADSARQQGAKKLPLPVKLAMRLTAKVMTLSTYRV